MDAKLAPDIEQWRSFVRAIGKPGAVVRVDVPHELLSGNTVWDGHSFGASTKFIGERRDHLFAADRHIIQHCSGRHNFRSS